MRNIDELNRHSFNDSVTLNAIPSTHKKKNQVLYLWNSIVNPSAHSLSKPILGYLCSIVDGNDSNSNSQTENNERLWIEEKWRKSQRVVV
jgi:hypothetical protein